MQNCKMFYFGRKSSFNMGFVPAMALIAPNFSTIEIKISSFINFTTI